LATAAPLCRLGLAAAPSGAGLASALSPRDRALPAPSVGGRGVGRGGICRLRRRGGSPPSIKTLPGEAAKTDAGHWTRTTFIDETGATNLPRELPPCLHSGSDAPFRLSRSGHDGVSGPDDAISRRHFGSAWPGSYRQSLFGVFERRQHCKPLLRPARQYDFVVGVKPEAVIPHDHHVGAQSEESTYR
jgi:hypothetical protein